MVMVKQYPHFLYVVRSIDGQSTQDEQGNWVEGVTESVYVSPCREETTGTGVEYQVAGGKFIKATTLIQLPISSPDIAPGAKIIVFDSDNDTERFSGVCLNFSRGQLHCRLWA